MSPNQETPTKEIKRIKEANTTGERDEVVLTCETELVTSIVTIVSAVVKETHAYATTIGTGPVSVRITGY